MKVPLPKGKYIANLEINDTEMLVNFKPRQKVALLFISLNNLYWPYLKTVIEDARKHFLPQHNVDFFVWTDIPDKDTPELKEMIAKMPTDAQMQQLREFAKTMEEAQQIMKLVSQETIKGVVDFVRDQKDIHLTFTEPIEWPMGTLMRYHLFLQKEEELKKYDHVYYLDVDMRILDKISDEVLSEGLMAAEHPMYSLKYQLVPPYEPNKESAAYIPRVGQVVDHNGKPRFKPLYLAGGFQGGKAKPFIKAMKKMKKNIDKDFNNNYMAIWNDESHWNKYLFNYDGPLTVLSPSYIYPDSLIKEYYEPIWGCSYPPKIMTLTKPWMLSKEGGDAIRKQLGVANPSPTLLPNKIQCEKCGDVFGVEGHHLKSVISCAGRTKPHQIDMVKLTV